VYPALTQWGLSVAALVRGPDRPDFCMQGDLNQKLILESLNSNVCLVKSKWGLQCLLYLGGF